MTVKAAVRVHSHIGDSLTKMEHDTSSGHEKLALIDLFKTWEDFRYGIPIKLDFRHVIHDDPNVYQSLDAFLVYDQDCSKVAGHPVFYVRHKLVHLRAYADGSVDDGYARKCLYRTWRFVQPNEHHINTSRVPLRLGLH